MREDEPEEKPGDAPGQGSVWEDPELFADGGDELLEQLRSLDSGTPGPGPEFGASLRARVVQRSRRLLRAQNAREHLAQAVAAIGWTFRRSRAFQLAFALLLLCVAFVVGREIWSAREAEQRRSSRQELTERARDQEPRDPVQVEPLSRVEESGTERKAWLDSEQVLLQLRRVFGERTSPEYPRRLLSIGGVDSRVARRVEYLAGAVAEDLENRLRLPAEFEFEAVEELSLSLRALLAAGSMLESGAHRELAERVLLRLEELMPRLAERNQVTAYTMALAGYLEGVLEAGRKDRLRRLGAGIARLCAIEQALQDASREQPQGDPHQETRVLPLVHWATPLAALVDAGLLLRVGPALGVSAETCQQLRGSMLRHLQARAARGPRSRASAEAAQLFAFGDLVDREALTRSLQGYRLYPDRLANDVRSLRYLAWSTRPKGYGFARVNKALRHFVANHEPRTMVERASLLLVQLFYVAPYFD